MNKVQNQIQAVLVNENFAPASIIRRAGRFIVLNTEVIVFSHVERKHIKQECNFRVLASDYITLFKATENEALIVQVEWESIRKGKGSGFQFTFVSTEDKMCLEGVSTMLKAKPRPAFVPAFA